MTAYYDLTINEFFDKVYEFWDKLGGNSYLRDKVHPASNQEKSKIEGAIYTVFWSLLRLANKAKIKEAAKNKNKTESEVIFLMIRDGCRVSISDQAKYPNSQRPFFTSIHESTFRKAFANKVDGNTKIKEALEKIEEYIESEKGAEKRKQFNAVQRRMFEETNVGDEKVSTHNYEAYKLEIMDAINNGAKQIILTGAPGTGKTMMAKEVAKEIVKTNEIVRHRIKEEVAKLSSDKEKAAKEDEIVKDYIEFVQFHPSFDYTDFVEGLRPVEDKDKDNNSTIVFRRVDGIFKSFCRKVVEENNSSVKYFFLIDEINRADLSKVFGELMYCLESDKRGPENRVQTPYQNLDTYFPDNLGETNDVFKDGFYIPENVYIIGTMNDIDRSVESMDFALRRRFMFREIEVTKPLLEGAFKRETFWYDSEKDTVSDTAKKEKRSQNAAAIAKSAETLAQRVMTMNEVMKAPAYKDFGLNEQYYISQGQFANLPDNAFTGNADVVKSVLDFVWEYRIKLLLREYVRGEDKTDAFITACEKALKDPVGGQNTSKDTADNAQAENGES